MGKPKPRNIADVIDAMLEHIPADETELRFDLERLKFNSHFTDPEIMRDRWVDGARVLFARFPEPGTDPTGWPQVIENIWRDVKS